MDSKYLINELIAAGAEPSEAAELANFEQSLKKPMFERSQELKLKNVNQVLGQLNKRSGFDWRRYIRPFGLALGGLSLAGASVFASQGSLPGEPLYPIKRLSETVFEQINPEFKDDIPVRRSEEVKSLIEKNENDDSIKKSLEDYQKQSSESENKDSIRQAEDNLKKAQEGASEKSKEEIEKVLNEGDVKGEQINKESENKGSSPKDSEQKSDGSDSSGENSSHFGGGD